MLARGLSMIRVSPSRSFAMLGALTALLFAWLWPLNGMARDLFAAHMLQHLLVMNVGALLIAVAWQFHGAHDHDPPSARTVERRPGAVPLVTIAQLAALWIWHMPAVFALTHHSPVLNVLMQMSLFVAALLFWRVVLRPRGGSAWPPILALLATAKIFCLLGAIFVFSRRTLYPDSGDPGAWGFSALEDQQLAGLLMVSSCAVTYVAAAIALFAKWLATIESPGRERSQWTRGTDASVIAR